MRNNLITLAILLLILNNCNEDKIEPLPVISSFSFNDDTLSILKIGTSDEFKVTGKIMNAESFIWDFGDGRTSTDTSVLLSYPESGIYTINLTATNSDGLTSSSAKKVIVLDRVLRKIVINNIQWDSTDVSFGWPSSNKVDVYFQIQLFTNNTMDPFGIYPNSPIVFTSSIVKDVNNQYYKNGTFVPIEIPVSEKIIIDRNLVVEATSDKLSNAYLFSLMAKDLNGNPYSLINNGCLGSGSSFGIICDDIEHNNFTVQILYYTSLKLVCGFE